MTVHEAIQILEKMPRFMELAFDFSPANSDEWILSPVATIEQVNIGEPEDVVLISRCKLTDEPPVQGSFSLN